jgi:hypothetical protein
MYQKVKKEVASANSCVAMETETIQKNGASPKSHTSRRNFLFRGLLLLMALCVGFSSCSKDDEGGDGSIVGLWTFVNITVDAQHPDNDMVEEAKGKLALGSLFLIRSTIEFKADKSWIFSVMGQSTGGTYSHEDGHFIMSADGTDYSEDTFFSKGSYVSINNNVLTIVQNMLDEIHESWNEKTYREAGFTKCEQKMTFKK